VPNYTQTQKTRERDNYRNVQINMNNDTGSNSINKTNVMPQENI